MESAGAVSIPLPREAQGTAVKSRMNWIDNAKGLATFFVVLGHTLAGLINAGIFEASPFLEFVHSWLYAFHVPVFFFISGLFAIRSLQKSSGTFVVDKLKVIVYPYILWTIIQFVLMSLVAGQTNTEIGALTLSNLLSALLVAPIMEFWYLYSLFLIYLLFWVVMRLTSSKTVFLAITFGIFLVGLAVKSQVSWVVASATFSSLIFGLGVYFSDWFRSRLPTLSTSTLALITALGFTVLTIGVGLPSYTVFQPFVLALLGIAATLGLSILFDRYRVPLVSGTLRLWGEKSLQIYVAHVIAAAGVRVILSRFLHYNDGLVHLVLGMIAGMYAPILLDWICVKVGFKYGFTLRSQ